MKTGSFFLHGHQDALCWEYKSMMKDILSPQSTDLTVSICLWTSEVHTTGTDTKQPLQSYAALTLSASMTFRDYATLGRTGSIWRGMFQRQGVSFSEVMSMPCKTEILSDTAWNSTKHRWAAEHSWSPGKGLGECVAWAKAKSCAAWWHATPNGCSL